MGKVKAGGREFAAHLTGGSLLRYKRKTGRDFLRHAEDADSEDLMLLAFLSLEDAPADYELFCNMLTMSEVNGIGAWIAAELRSDDGTDKDGDTKKKD